MPEERERVTGMVYKDYEQIKPFNNDNESHSVQYREITKFVIGVGSDFL